MTEYYTYQKKKIDVGSKPAIFHDTEVKVMGFLPTQQQGLSANHQKRNPNFLILDNIAEMSEHQVNTERVSTADRGMYHKEGGWQTGTDPTEPESTNKWRKKIEKDPAFAVAVKNLCQNTEKAIYQNNQIDLFEEYFHHEESEHFVENLSTKTLMLFKDPETVKRSVSKISWHPDGPTKVAVAYSILRFQQMPENMPTQSYIWDLNDPNVPESTLLSTSPITSIAFNHKNTDQIAGGCYNGLVACWDMKQKGGPAIQSKFAPIELSHYDPVYDLVWLSSKTGSEFVTTSTDGKILWWDLRNLVAPTESFVLSEGAVGPEGKERYVGGTCIEYVPDVGPTKYLVGTEQGSIMTVNKRPKKPVDIYPRFGVDSSRHYGPVTALQRNPAHNKYFMSVGDWTVKIWNEDAKNLINRTRYHNAYLSDGTWSPTRPGLFFVTRRDGWIDSWDYFYRQNEIAFSHKVSDSALTCIKINTTGGGNMGAIGRYAAVGDQDGTVTLLELCDSLYIPASNEKDSILEIFERETRKEKNLEQQRRQAEGKTKAQRENRALKEWEEHKPEILKKCEDAFFAAMGKHEDAMLDDDKDEDGTERQKPSSQKLQEPQQEEQNIHRESDDHEAHQEPEQDAQGNAQANEQKEEPNKEGAEGDAQKEPEHKSEGQEGQEAEKKGSEKEIQQPSSKTNV